MKAAISIFKGITGQKSKDKAAHCQKGLAVWCEGRLAPKGALLRDSFSGA
jgi:hypothetical protein